MKDSPTSNTPEPLMNAISMPVTCTPALDDLCPDTIASAIWFELPCAALVPASTGPVALSQAELLCELAAYASLFRLASFSFSARSGGVLCHWHGAPELDDPDLLATEVRREIALIRRLADGDGPRRALLADLPETLAMAA